MIGPSPRIATGLLSAVLLVSCGRTPPDFSAAVDSLRFSAEPLLSAHLEGERTGKVMRQTVTPESLFTADNVDLLRHALEAETDSVQRHRLGYLLGYFGLRHLHDALAKAGDRGRTSRLELADSIAHSMRFGSAGSLVELASGVPTEETTLLARLTLAKTDSLANFMPGDPPQAARTPQLVQTPASQEIQRFDGVLGTKSREDAVVHTFARAGFPLSFVQPPGRPASGPEDSLLLVDCGHDRREMRLSVPAPTGMTLADLEGLLHRTGVCLHASYTREFALEFRFLGDPAVRQAFGFLFQNLAGNQAWLRQHTSLPPAKLKDLLEFQSRRELSHMRTDCQIRLSRTGILGEISADGAGVRLRARILEAIFDSVLTARFGANWFENPGAYALLKELWASGTRFSSETLAHRLGAEGLTPGPWQNRLVHRLRFATR